MPSPSGIFVGLPLAQLQQMQQDIVQAAMFGDVTSEGGGGKTEGRQPGMTPLQRGVEITFAIEKVTGKLPNRNVVQVLPGCGRNRGIL